MIIFPKIAADRVKLKTNSRINKLISLMINLSTRKIIYSWLLSDVELLIISLGPFIVAVQVTWLEMKACLSL